MWAAMEATEPEPEFTKYEDPSGRVVYRQRLSAAHIQRATRFTLQISRLYGEANEEFTQADFNKAWSIGITAAMLYKKSDNGGMQRVVRDPFMFYTLPPEESTKATILFLQLAKSCEVDKVKDKIEELREIVNEAYPSPNDNDNGDDKKKSTPPKQS